MDIQPIHDEVKITISHTTPILPSQLISTKKFSKHDSRLDNNIGLFYSPYYHITISEIQYGRGLVRQIDEYKNNISIRVVEEEKSILEIQNALDKYKHVKKEIEADEHLVDINELYNRYNTDKEKGLSSEGVEHNKHVYGSNVLSLPKTTSSFRKWFDQLFYGFNILLWVAAFLSGLSLLLPVSTGFSFDPLYVLITILIVIFVSATLTWYVQEKAISIMESFKNLVPEKTTVLRDGQFVDINVSDVVVGDICFMKAGDKISADLRIIESLEMKIDNSTFTGESESITRTTRATSDNPLETKNVLFTGSYITEGSGSGLVFRVGDNTILGRITFLSLSTERPEPFIRRDIRLFSRVIAVFTLILILISFIIGFFRLDNPLDLTVILISIAVGNIPESLSPAVTVSMQLASLRMSQRNVVVKSMESIETLGACNCICTDKTGTLTQNKMTVTSIFCNNHCYSASSQPNSMVEELKSTFPVLFFKFIRIAALCSSSKSYFSEGRKEYRGSATEKAVLKFIDQFASEQIPKLQKCYPTVFNIPFSSKNKFQITIHTDVENDNQYILLMKGALERIITRCSFIALDDENIVLSEEQKSIIENKAFDFGNRSERVLAYCYLELDKNQYKYPFSFSNDPPNYPLDGYVFIALTSMYDPPRKNVPSSIKKCHDASIKVVMITGDFSATAKAISREIGIIQGITVDELKSSDSNESNSIVISGDNLSNFTETDWDNALRYRDVVFCRTSPQQKLEIVTHFQKLGYIVTVTGDGVNDSAALKKADAGIAMGSGSAVAKESANFVILDDDFSSVVAGIEEGRLMFDNLKKSVLYAIQHTVPEVVPILLYIIVLIPLPLTALLILVIDLCTDVGPAISLSYEQAEYDIMRIPPRNIKTDRLITKRLVSWAFLQIGLIQLFAVLVNYFSLFWIRGISPDSLINSANDWNDPEVIIDGKNSEERAILLGEAQATVFLTIVIVQFAGLIAVRTSRISVFNYCYFNINLLWTSLLALIISVSIIYIPAIQDFFSVNGPPWYCWLIPMPFFFFIIIYDEIRKYFIRNYPQSCIAKHFYY